MAWVREQTIPTEPPPFVGEHVNKTVHLWNSEILQNIIIDWRGYTDLHICCFIVAVSLIN
jgi:hypothetical protein